MFTWPLVVFVLGLVSLMVVRYWIDQRSEMEREHHKFQHRAFAMEERKFEVWKTSKYAHAASIGKAAEGVIKTAMRDMTPQMMPADDGEPMPGKVLSMPQRQGPFKMKDGMKVLAPRRPKVLHGSVPNLSETEMLRIAELLEKAKDMPEEEARKFLRENGLQEAEFEE